MTLAQLLTPEYEQEAAITRRVLERVPSDKLDWAPHPKSMTLGKLAGHVAEIPSWVVATLGQTELDMADYTAPEPKDSGAIMAAFDAGVAAGVPVLAAAADADFSIEWTLRSGDYVIFTLPRLAVIRTWVINHTVHHRAQLGVYLRLLDVPVPGIYGPSADDPGM